MVELDVEVGGEKYQWNETIDEWEGKAWSFKPIIRLPNTGTEK
ncbi:hypothetical protein [Thalassobacillus devorans]|nr:hypothetical protein [Thalassobacillus devorans]